MIWSLSRWSLTFALAAFALIQMNHALYSAWQTAAPPGSQYPEAWAYQAYKSFGLGIATLAAAGLAAINLRRGWPYAKSKWTGILLVMAMVGILLPRTQHFFDVDACLDQGGRWNYVSQTCQK